MQMPQKPSMAAYTMITMKAMKTKTIIPYTIQAAQFLIKNRKIMAITKDSANMPRMTPRNFQNILDTLVIPSVLTDRVSA